MMEDKKVIFFPLIKHKAHWFNTDIYDLYKGNKHAKLNLVVIELPQCLIWSQL